MKDSNAKGTAEVDDTCSRVERCLSMVLHHQEVEEIAEVVKQVLKEGSDLSKKDNVS